MNRRYDITDINKQLVWNLRDIGHTISQLSEGKASQKRILGMLRELGEITQCELTQRLGVQPGTASEVLGKLEASGLILRIPSEKDLRTQNIRLTEEGTKAGEEICRQRQERYRQMFCGLTEEEKEMLLGLLEKVNGDWDQRYREKTKSKIHRMWYRKADE